MAASITNFPISQIANDEPSLAAGGAGPHDPGMEARVAKLESDVGHIKSDISEIKSLLARLAPRIDETYGKLPYFGTAEDLAKLSAEIERRPTRRQAFVDIGTIVGIIGVLLTIGAKLAL